LVHLGSRGGSRLSPTIKHTGCQRGAADEDEAQAEYHAFTPESKPKAVCLRPVAIEWYSPGPAVEPFHAAVGADPESAAAEDAPEQALPCCVPILASSDNGDFFD